MNTTYLHLTPPDSAYQIPAQWWYVIFGICIGAILLSVILSDRSLVPALIAALLATLAIGTAPRAVYQELIQDTAGDLILVSYPGVPIWCWYASGLLLLISVVLIIGGIALIPASASKNRWWK
jgi:uncharacterized membrane protein YdcZ (DUF606 family)